MRRARRQCGGRDRSRLRGDRRFGLDADGQRERHRGADLSATLEVRRLGPADLVSLRGLNALFGEAFGDRATYAGAPPADAYCRDLLADPRVIVVAAIAEGRVAGGICAYVLRKLEQERSEVYLYDLAVAQDRRREGLATALIAETRRIARAIGAGVIFVQADQQDEAAVALYRKLATGEEAPLHFDILP